VNLDIDQVLEELADRVMDGPSQQLVMSPPRTRLGKPFFGRPLTSCKPLDFGVVAAESAGWGYHPPTQARFDGWSEDHTSTPNPPAAPPSRQFPRDAALNGAPHMRVTCLNQESAAVWGGRKKDG